MTDEQKFEFDLKGWIAIPEVLTREEVEKIREHVVTLHDDHEKVPEIHRYASGGPGEFLLDHPVVVGILREIIAQDRTDDCYGFRCENSFSIIRNTGETGPEPHGGGGNVGPLAYGFAKGQIYSGLTRVVWELNDVKKGTGGTLFLSGSHKMNYPIPEAHTKMDSPLYETYGCPAGSLVIFSEGVAHAGPTWTNPDHPRVTILNCYSSTVTQYHKLNIKHETVRQMPLKRQTLFRGVWVHDFDRGQPNDYYDDTNQSL